MNTLPSLHINDMLKKYNYTEVSTQQLAEHLNFSEEEQKMIKMFWEPTFNGSWIYLNDEIILGQLITDTGRSALTNFYKRVLLTEEYIENVDYKQINKDDELVKEYDQNDSSRKLNQKNKAKQGAKKYYAVTGETYKDLLQRSANKKGKTTRQYYRKIEQLAIMMKDYLVALNSYLMQKQIDATKLELKSKTESYNRINDINSELLTFKKNNQKNESIYIVATRRYASQGIFKIGRTKSMKARSSAHNDTHVVGDKVKILKEYMVGDCVAVENYVHRSLNGFLIQGEKEFFLCPYNILIEILDVIVNDNGSHTSFIDCRIDLVNNLRISNSIIWTKELDENKFKDEYKLICLGDQDQDKAIFDVSTFSEQGKREFILNCIKAYKEQKEKEEQNTIVTWKEFQPFLKPLLNLNKKSAYRATEWKNIFNSVIG